jgi:hypothetical protein
MKWIAEKLLKDEIVSFTAHGKSMSPRIDDKTKVTVCPVKEETIVDIDSVVFCKVKGNYLLHKVKAIRTTKNKKQKFLIANNKGHENGWISKASIFGILPE